jgi:hypothetical protein
MVALGGFSANSNTEIDGGPRSATEGVNTSDNEALKAVLQMGRVVIQQRTDADLAHAQVGRNLCFVCREEGRDASDSKNNRTRDQRRRSGAIAAH